MLIRNAEVWLAGLADLRTEGGIITAIGTLSPQPGEVVIDAGGAAVLPGLHDHHIHLAATAVRRQSIVCGPPEVRDASDLAKRLGAAPGTGWLRGILYHESVAGLPNARDLDTICSHRPLRIQHRSGRMWLFNSAGLALVLAKAAPPPGLEMEHGKPTGRLFDEDTWLRSVLGAAPPAFDAVSRELAAFGVIGVTDMSPSNGPEMAAHFAEEEATGRLLQTMRLAGTLALGSGPAKLHLHENALPDFDETVTFVRAAHASGRPVASHCTTETELVFTLAAIAEAGALPGDRIEHAGIARDSHIAQMAELGVAVCGQPHFIAERGDQYLTDVEPDLVPLLYRQASFLKAGIPLVAGSDAPFGSLDPWLAMQSAMTRRTAEGHCIGANEALTAEEAVALYLADPDDRSRQRTLEIGAPADLCLLHQPWQEARKSLKSDLVRATFIGGKLVHQAPGEGFAGVQAPA
ncbi:amidohydrolase family protein [Novosphingobium sp.]|uniref:amidohydrolase family protein n=1 Tax=Novosphingobium sp. TaxID=1874826 RepID=UPI00286DDB4F|nr:amidohydrolase family protein [Novosphingobium sp.]